MPREAGEERAEAGPLVATAARPVELAELLARADGASRLELDAEGPARQALGLAVLLARRLARSGWRVEVSVEGEIHAAGGSLSFAINADQAESLAALAAILQASPLQGRARIALRAERGPGGGSPRLSPEEAQYYSQVKVNARIHPSS